MGTAKTPDDLSPLARAWAAEIRAERNAQHLTQTELAKRARLSLSTVARIEGERVDAGADQMWALCRALGISVTELTERAERRIETARRGGARKASGS